jgi:hypothetical protein
MEPLVIKILVPFNRYPPSQGVAVVLIAEASDPASASVRANAARCSAVAILG